MPREQDGMKILAWGLSDTGVKRDHNEDSILMNEELGLFAVADGMGGHAAGDRASRIAVDTLERETKEFLKYEDESPSSAFNDSLAKSLGQAVQEASREIHREASKDKKLDGMGTTLTSILLRGGRFYLAHVGDSRCFLFRDGRIEQITSDHSWVEEQVRAGFMTRDEAEQSALKHVVTRSVGFEKDIEVDLMAMPVLTGDCYLLCSDGLSNYLSENQLKGFLTKSYYSELPKRLIDTANALGGDDNISVIVIYAANDCRLESQNSDDQQK